MKQKVSVLVCPLLCIPSIFSLTAQESPAPPAPQQTSPAPLPANKYIDAKNLEALNLAGFPVGVITYEPALVAAFRLTQEQVDQLKKLREDTIGQAKLDLEGIEDKRQANILMERAKKEFNSVRDSLLTDEQLSFIGTIKSALLSATKQFKENKPEAGAQRMGLRELFLITIKPSLNADQMASFEAAGGKFP